MTRSPSVVVCALAVATLATATLPAVAANDRIAPGRAIGRIAVGDERATIALRLGGDGVVISRVRNPVAPGNRNLDRVVVAYPALSLAVRFPTDEASTPATVVSTRSARYRTARGAGVGVTRAALRRAHAGATCAGDVCTLSSPSGITRFHLSGGRVIRVAVRSR